MGEIELKIVRTREKLASQLLDVSKTLAVAESCTGGLLAKTLTDQAGSSEWFNCGVVSYSNASKQALLKVDAELIKSQGAVSWQVAEQMVEGLIGQSLADIAISTTGIAGPAGGSIDKPIGLVWFGLKQKGLKAYSIKHEFSGSREQVRLKAVLKAMELMQQELS